MSYLQLISRVDLPKNRTCGLFWIPTIALGMFCYCIVLQNNALAQQRSAAASLGDLSEAEYQALGRITQGSVTGTISFLASDELAGRGTPSKELTIASAYVASRLRAAGAQGLGPDGSFYLETELDTVRSPDAGGQLRLAADSGSGLRISILNGGREKFSYSGRVSSLAVDNPQPLPTPGPAVIRIPDESSRSLAAQVRTLAQLAKSAGATALLLTATELTPLQAYAKSQQDNLRVSNPRRGLALPVAVVVEGELDFTMEYALTIPANVVEPSIVRNVAGVIRGSDAKLQEEAIVFSAHLDHLGTFGDGEDNIYNGADDDASGVTAVLTLADAFGALETPTARSTIFMTFWGEERGLLGSKQLVESPPWPLDKIIANVNIEMIGRPEQGAENKMWMTGWQQSDLGQLMAQGSRRLGVETFEHPRFSAMLYRASDNYAFVAKGVVAHSFSAGSLHDDYHQTSDEWEKLNLVHMTQIIRGIYAGTLPITNGQVTPVSK